MKHQYFTLAFLLLLVMCSSESKATIFMVTNTANAGPGSLRDAMTLANANANVHDTILFNINGPMPYIITPLSPLPILSDVSGVFIDGLSQPGSFAGATPPRTATLMVYIDGILAGPCSGLETNTGNNIIQGLGIGNFSFDGIRIEASLHPTANNTIYCNFIGTDITGMTTMPNGTLGSSAYAGVYIRPSLTCSGQAFSNFVINNLVSANNGDGVAISACPPSDVFDNYVLNNYIGTDITGLAALGNQHAGVYLGEGTHDNTVAANVISSNMYEGVSIIGYIQGLGPIWFTDHNHVLDNLIGSGRDSSTILGNFRDGVAIGKWGPNWSLGHARFNDVQNNIIVNNGRNGVMVWEHNNSINNADGNLISQNSIFNNALLGIDLDDNGVTLNDSFDPDNGANEDVNFPTITSISLAGGNTTVSGTLDISTSPTAAVVELFKVGPGSILTGYGQGMTYLGNATPNTSGNWTTTLSGLIVGDSICATTTDTAGNTSEFSQNGGVVVLDLEQIASSGIDWSVELPHPNPMKKQLSWNLHTEKGMNLLVSISSVYGQVVREYSLQFLSKGQHLLSWNGYSDYNQEVPQGIYLLTIQKGNEIMVFKIIKQ